MIVVYAQVNSLQLGLVQCCTLQTKELEQQEAEAAEALSGPQVGRGKGNFATKVHQPSFFAFAHMFGLTEYYKDLLSLRNAKAFTDLRQSPIDICPPSTLEAPRGIRGGHT